MFSSPSLPRRNLYRLVLAVSLPAVLMFILLSLLPSPARADSVIYVDADAAGAATGLSWTDAFTNVQDALAAAVSADQIWVAKGVYYPDEGGGQPNDVLTATFTLANEISLYGGFTGSETQLDQRDPAVNTTVLSGDIDKNDVTNLNGVVTDTVGIVGVNAYHVVTGGGTDGSAVLDGFTITAGQASFPDNRGGGMYNESSSPSLTGVTFSGNSASTGGGMYNDGSNPSLTGVTFSGNSAESRGGGMANNNGSAPALTGVIFISNTAFTGGGMHNGNSSPPSLNGVTFSANTAGNGGGMYNSNSSPNLIQVTFNDNNADLDGGGMANNGSSPTLTNVAFSGNSAVGDGGGMFSNNSNPTLIDVTFSDNGGTNGGGMRNQGGMPTLTEVSFHGNIANNGGGMSNLSSTPTLTNVSFTGNSANFNGGGVANSSSSPTLTNVTFSGNSASGNGGGMDNGNNSDATLTNVILWGDTASTGPEIYNNSSSPVIAYSDVQGCGGSGSWDTTCGTDDGNNIDAAPLLVDPDGADDTPGTFDDDLRLSAGSPAIDTGDNNSCPPNDLAGVLRPIDGDGDGQANCDIGAFEYHIPTITAVLSDAPDPSGPGQPFTVTVSVTASLGAPTGMVTVTVAGDPGLCGTTLTSGMGSCSLALSAPGTYTLTVAYAGDGAFSPSSATESHTVEASSFGLYLPIIRRD